MEIRDLAYDSRRVGDGHAVLLLPRRADRRPRLRSRRRSRPGAAALVRRAPARPRRAPGAGRGRQGGDGADRGRPSTATRPRSSAVVGITGTNGKTTTAFLVRHLLESAGTRCGLLGTVQQVVGGRVEEVERTTPEAIDLQRTFDRMLESGDEYCAMEVSSHALVLHRADAIHFAAKVFTNLSQDHLDFHADMEDYFEAKRLLFSGEGGAPIIELEGGVSVINVDDPYGRRLAEELDCGSGGDCVSYSAAGGEADLSARGRHLRRLAARASSASRRRASSRCEIAAAGRLQRRQRAGRPLRSPTRSAWTCERPRAALASAEQVPGRFESIDEGQPFARGRRLRAHTRLAGERAGGGPAADRGPADLGVRRRRGPRSREAAADGPGGGGALRRRGGHLRQPALRGPRRRSSSRSEAGSEEPARPRSWSSRTGGRRSRWRSARAGEGDKVVIAGKGHEQGQEFEDGRKIPFDDRDVAREELRKLSESRRALIALDGERLASAAGAEVLASGGDGGPARVVIDSREVREGDLFVGLPGERFDGGEFGAAALRRGRLGDPGRDPVGPRARHAARRRRAEDAGGLGARRR